MEKSKDLQETQIEKGIDNNNTKKLRYPLQVFFIVSNEFCERFMYLGMRGKFQPNKTLPKWRQL